MSRSAAATLFFLLCLPPAPAEACTCVAIPPSCQAAWDPATSAIFAGRVEEISVLPGKGPTVFRRRLVRFTVIEAFKGTTSPTVEVQTGAGGGDCGYRFRKGSEYLVYAHYNDGLGRLVTGTCGRTKQLAPARDDVAYLRAAFRDNAPIGRIAGTIELSQRDLPRRLDRRRPAPGVAVVIQGNGVERTTLTDASGRFAVDGLEAGKYSARIEVPKTHYGEFRSSELELVDRRGCAETTGTVAYDGRVRGRITDASGHGVPGLTVDLTVVSGLQYPQGAERIQAVTNGTGEYEVTRVPPGSYLIGVNTAPQDDDPKLPRFFHPGVEGIGDATRVRVGPGERTSTGPFVLPTHTPTIGVSGVVLDPDGVPAAGARVFLARVPRFIIGMPVVADDQGRFTLAAFEAFEYRVFAERRDGEDWQGSQASDPQPFTAVAGLPPFRLVLRRRY